jgi:hypothetical protein
MTNLTSFSLNFFLFVVVVVARKPVRGFWRHAQQLVAKVGNESKVLVPARGINESEATCEMGGKREG